MQPEGTIKQRIRRLHEEKPGKVTIDDLLEVVPSRREQSTWTFVFAVIRLHFMWPTDSKQSDDVTKYLTRRRRFAPGYVHAALSTALRYVDCCSATTSNDKPASCCGTYLLTRFVMSHHRTAQLRQPLLK
jgi:hypothetical protein